MGFLKDIADAFVKAKANAAQRKQDNANRYNIMAPLLATESEVAAALDLIRTMNRSGAFTYLSGKSGGEASGPKFEAYKAYHEFLRQIGSNLKTMEYARPFEAVNRTLQTIQFNLNAIQDNFVPLMGSFNKDLDGARISSFVVLGYIQAATTYATWVSQMAAHISPDDDSGVAPFWTKQIHTGALAAAQFSIDNFVRWSQPKGGLIGDLRLIQKQGLDATIASGGKTIDSFMNDSMFAPAHQTILKAGARSPVMMWMTRSDRSFLDDLEAIEAKRQWLISKVAIEEAKAAGMDPNSAEYKKLRKAIDFYANEINKKSQKLERMRA